MRVVVTVFALVAVGWAQEAPAAAPSTRTLEDGKLTERYWSFTYEGAELAEDELGLGGPDVLFEGTIAGGLRVVIRLIEAAGPVEGKKVRDFRKKGWAQEGAKLVEPVEGDDPFVHMLFVQESLAGFKRHHGYAWLTRGFHCFELHVEATEKTATSGDAIKKALAALKLGGDKGANFAQYAIAKQQNKPLNDPGVVFGAARYYLGSAQQRRAPNYPVAASLFAKAREFVEGEKNPYEPGATYLIYENGGLAILSPPLRDAAASIDWHLKAEEAAKNLPEEQRGSSAGVSAYNVACAYALLDKLDEAFAALERSFAHTPGKPPVTAEHLAQDTDLDSLRGDARWKAFVAKVFPAEKPADAPDKPDGG